MWSNVADVRAHNVNRVTWRERIDTSVRSEIDGLGTQAKQCRSALRCSGSSAAAREVLSGFGILLFYQGTGLWLK